MVNAVSAGAATPTGRARANTYSMSTVSSEPGYLVVSYVYLMYLRRIMGAMKNLLGSSPAAVTVLVVRVLMMPKWERSLTKSAERPRRCTVATEMRKWPLVASTTQYIMQPTGTEQNGEDMSCAKSWAGANCYQYAVKSRLLLSTKKFLVTFWWPRTGWR